MDFTGMSQFVNLSNNFVKRVNCTNSRIFVSWTQQILKRTIRFITRKMQTILRKKVTAKRRRTKVYTSKQAAQFSK